MTDPLTERHFAEFVAEGFDPPSLPAGWKNTSYRNDTGPSYQRGRFWVHIDHPIQDQREFPDCEAPRFTVHLLDEDGGLGGFPEDHIKLQTDDWETVVEYVDGASPDLLIDPAR